MIPPHILRPLVILGAKAIEKAIRDYKENKRK
jgi:hypothetical protein